jgi:hypothetical protein
MSKEREIKTETNWIGEERKVIYEDGQKVGELRSEDRGGLFGIGADRVDVEYNNDGSEVSYTKPEDRGGLLGIGAEETRVTYDSNTDKEIEASRVELRGGLFGIGSHYVRVGRDSEGNEISQTNHENRGGFLGIGGERVKVTRDTSNISARQATAKTINSPGSSHSSATPLYTDNRSSGHHPLVGSIQASVTFLGIVFLIIIVVLYVGKILMVMGSFLTGLPHAADGFFEFLLFVPLGIIGALVWLAGFVMSVPLFAIEHITGLCLTFGPGTVLHSSIQVRTISFCN